MSGTKPSKLCDCGFPQSSPIPHEHSREAVAMSDARRWDEFETREERADRIQELLGLRAYVAKLEAERDQLKRERDLLVHQKRVLEQNLSDLGSSHLLITHQRDSAVAILKPMANWHSFCCECGANVTVDEDGMCTGCGATAFGDALNAWRWKVHDAIALAEGKEPKP